MSDRADVSRVADTLPPLSPSTASAYARVGLANVDREYPNNPGHLLTGPEDLLPPSQLHPIFFGSYDWHSSVHQHWMLVRLLRRVPALPEADEIHELLDDRLHQHAAEVEADYLRSPQRRAFERPYGWAWLLTLHAELADLATATVTAAGGQPVLVEAAARWRAGLAPLAEVVRGRTLEWLRTTPYPQRSGTHANSAFACGLLHDAARTGRDPELLAAVETASRRWYDADAGYPAWLEPSASDFLSPALAVADLLRRLLPAAELGERLRRLLPDPEPLTRPATVSDRTDPQTVHLDGLNLSRAWCWLEVGSALPHGHELRSVAAMAARRHAEASLPAVLSGAYVGEHWLPTFAVRLLDVADRVAAVG